MQWVYLSPHFDDAVLSCGGLIWQQIRQGDQVEIWTICAGEIPQQPLTAYALSLHERWQTGENAVAARRKEDITACRLLGVGYVHFVVPDCVYRTFPDGKAIVEAEEDLFKPLKPGEMGLVARLAADLYERLPVSACLVSPLSVGGHVDHRLVRAAAEQLRTKLWYYADYPYAAGSTEKVEVLAPAGHEPACLEFCLDALAAWQRAVACYESQLSTFWGDLAQMEKAVAEYSFLSGCHSFWQPG